MIHLILAIIIGIGWIWVLWEMFGRRPDADHCRGCGVALRQGNVWEPGTCLNCAKKLRLDQLHA